MRSFIVGAALAATLTAANAAPPLRSEVLTVTPNQVVDIADARIAQLKANLRLTTDQDKNWGGFQSALHDLAVGRADRMNKLREQRSAQANAPVTTPAPGARDPRLPDVAADLRTQADAFTARADEYRRFADAAGPLYDGLDDGQRRRFLQFVQQNLTNEGPGAPPPGMRRF